MASRMPHSLGVGHRFRSTFFRCRDKSTTALARGLIADDPQVRVSPSAKSTLGSAQRHPLSVKKQVLWTSSHSAPQMVSTSPQKKKLPRDTSPMAISFMTRDPGNTRTSGPLESPPGLHETNSASTIIHTFPSNVSRKRGVLVASGVDAGMGSLQSTGGVEPPAF